MQNETGYFTADLLLPSLWYMTASGTVRRALFLIWTLESQGTYKRQVKQRIEYGWKPKPLFKKMVLLPHLIMKGGADQLCTFFGLILTVPEAVSSHTKVKIRSDVQSILCFALHCPSGSLVQYKTKEHQFHPVLALQGRRPNAEGGRGRKEKTPL